MKIISNKKLDQIFKLYFKRENFEKFENPYHPLYKQYRDRNHEKWHDIGYNNAIETILMIILNKGSIYEVIELLRLRK